MRTNQKKQQTAANDANDSDKLIEKWFSITNLSFHFRFCLSVVRLFCLCVVWNGIESIRMLCQ